MSIRIVIKNQDSKFLEFESTISLAHSSSVQVTNHPVEADIQGSVDITDHIKSEPETLSINGIVSNFPLILDPSINRQPSVPGGNSDLRVWDAYNFLRDAKENGDLLTVGTRLHNYTNMVIVGLSTTQDKDSSEILDVAVDLRQIRTATTESVPAPEPIESPRENKTDRGRRPTTPVSPAVEEKVTKNISALRSFTR